MSYVYYVKCARKFYNPKYTKYTHLFGTFCFIIGPSYDKVIIKNYTPRKIHTNAQVKCSYLNQPSG